jgi:acylphosphatase
MKKPAAAVKLTGNSTYLTNRDIRVLIEAHDRELSQLRNELQQLRDDTMKLVVTVDVLFKHTLFEFALRPVQTHGVKNV